MVRVPPLHGLQVIHLLPASPVSFRSHSRPVVQVPGGGESPTTCRVAETTSDRPGLAGHLERGSEHPVLLNNQEIKQQLLAPHEGGLEVKCGVL